jgi:hypothetical protein
MKYLLLILLPIGLLGCFEREVFQERHEIERLRVQNQQFLDEYAFSILYRDGTELIDIRVSESLFYEQKPRVFVDVPFGSNMWFESEGIKHNGVLYGYTKFHIHIRDKSDLEPVIELAAEKKN